MSGGKINSINISNVRGVAKVPVQKGTLKTDWGFVGDAHAEKGIRQVSLLAFESITKQQECPHIQSKGIPLSPGDFAENITTEGLDLTKVNIGDRLMIGLEVLLEITKIGKECHRYCSIYYKTGDCIMPREGIFAKVIRGGEIYVNDEIVIVV